MLKAKRLVLYFNAAYEWASIACLIVVIVASVLQVFTRTVLNASMVGTEEIARYAFVWMSFLGASICTSKRAHASLGMLNDSLKRSAKCIHLIIIHFAMLVFAVVLIFHGTALLSFVGKQLSPTLRIPMPYIYGACPVGAVGIFINCMIVITEEIKVIRYQTWERGEQ